MRFLSVLVTFLVILSASLHSVAASQCSQLFKRIEIAKLPQGLVEFPEQSPWIKTTSEKTLQRLQKSNLAAVEAQIKAQSYKQAVVENNFQNGSLYVEAGNLVWKNRKGEVQLLVDKLEHPDRGITNIAISPDGKKVAYSTTLSGSDQHVWYIKSIASQSRSLLQEPLLVRMDGFSWGKDSETVYYSHFAKIEKVVDGSEPIQVVRVRNLKTGKDRMIFDHGFRANFAIFDVNGGQTLIAHRILGPGAGIKALLMMYKGERKSDGSYHWTALVEPNRWMGHFLGTINKGGVEYAVMQNNHFTKRYGISMVPLKSEGRGLSAQIKVFTPPAHFVVHNSQMHQGHLFLEFYNPKTLQTRWQIVDAHTGKLLENVAFSDYGLLNLGSMGLPVSFNGGDVTVKYTDVLGGAVVLSYNLKTRKLQALANPEANPFNSKNVRVSVVSYPSKDGVTVRAMKMYPVDAQGKPVKPKFFLLKSYGMIGIKSAAEPLEAQMTLLRGGVYVAPDIRGGAGPNSDWQVAGSRDFDLRFADVEATAHYMTKVDPMFAKYNFASKDVTVLVGRSYNGSGVLEMAARFPTLAKMFISVVPVWDFEAQLNESRFGVLAHSDRFPDIHPVTGDLDLNGQFWANVAKNNPARLLHQIPEGTDLYVYTGGRDDRVDQLHLEQGYAQQLAAQLGNHFRYIQNPTASHAPRWYMDRMFAEIDLMFGGAN